MFLICQLGFMWRCCGRRELRWHGGRWLYSVRAVGILGENIHLSRIAENRVNGGLTYGDWHRNGIRIESAAANLLDCNSSIDVGSGIVVGGASEPSWLIKNEFKGPPPAQVLSAASLVRLATRSVCN